MYRFFSRNWRKIQRQTEWVSPNAHHFHRLLSASAFIPLTPRCVPTATNISSGPNSSTVPVLWVLVCRQIRFGTQNARIFRSRKTTFGKMRRKFLTPQWEKIELCVALGQPSTGRWQEGTREGDVDWWLWSVGCGLWLRTARYRYVQKHQWVNRVLVWRWRTSSSCIHIPYFTTV
jgi:hypothetical protein